MTRHLERGWLLLDLGRYREASAEFQKARAANESPADASAGMAFACLGLGQAGEATTHAEQALAHSPDSWLGHCALGRAWRERNQLVKARAHIHEALRLEPNRAMLHQDLAAIALDAGKPKEAESFARNGLRVEPFHLGCREALIQALLRQKRLPEARVVAGEALAAHPDSAPAHRLVALVAVFGDDYAPARHHAMEALRIDPTDTSARELYVESLKNSYPVYSSVVHAGLKVGNFLAKPALIAPLALFPPCAGVALLLVVGFTSVTSAVNDVAFALKPETRRLLTPAEAKAVPWLIITLALLPICFATTAITDSEQSLHPAIVGVLLLRPIRAGFDHWVVGSKRWFLCLTGVTGLVAVAAQTLSLCLDAETFKQVAVAPFFGAVILYAMTLSARFQEKKPAEAGRPRQT